MSRTVSIYPMPTQQEAEVYTQAVDRHLGYADFRPYGDTRSIKHTDDEAAGHEDHHMAINTMGRMLENFVSHTMKQNKDLVERMDRQTAAEAKSSKRQHVHPIATDMKPLTRDTEPLGRVELVHNFTEGDVEAQHPQPHLVQVQTADEKMMTITIPPRPERPLNKPEPNWVRSSRRGTDHLPLKPTTHEQKRLLSLSKRSGLGNKFKYKVLLAKSKLQGAAKDMKRLNEVEGKGILSKLVTVCTAEDRGPFVGGLFLSLLLLFVLIFIAIGAMVAPPAAPKRLRQQSVSSFSTGSFTSDSAPFAWQ